MRPCGSVDRLRARLRRFNPTAVQLDAVRDPVSATQLLASDIYDPLAKSEEVRRWLAEEEHVAGGHDHDGSHRHGHDINRHGDDIVAFSVRLDEPLQWAAFAVWLTMLLNRHGQAILRVKGLLRVAGA
jgi:G3E family GTPase